MFVHVQETTEQIMLHAPTLIIDDSKVMHKSCRLVTHWMHCLGVMAWHGMAWLVGPPTRHGSCVRELEPSEVPLRYGPHVEHLADGDSWPQPSFDKLGTDH